jgi:NAD(P)-dependent dehydrogenase (short-subunit alcohol dehydrogenase family)
MKSVALVSGGTNGIGRAVMRRLLETGWDDGVIDLTDGGLHRAFCGEMIASFSRLSAVAPA